ncbi:cell wall metabolism sensor histidine kinase WalK [bacterium]|nr:cell wall metabolism sensor histidine kinase WalK [bacterium]
MKRRRIVWQLFPSYLLITLISILVVTIFTASMLHSFFMSETEDNLAARARLIEPEILTLIEKSQPDTLNDVVRTLGHRSDTRITIIHPDGVVLADSEHDPLEMDLHNNRPEVKTALRGETGSSRRFSATLQTDMMYVAVPLFHNDTVFAIIRTSKSLKSVNDTIRVLLITIGIGSLIVALAAAGISWINARRISQPLEQMKLYARRVAAGDREGRLPEEGGEEVAALAEAINLMLIQLDDRIRVIERTRNEQDAVFASISDGVLAVDAEGLLISINKAAARMFSLKRSKVRGRTVRDVIEHSDLRNFIGKSLQTEDEVEDELLLGDLDPRYIQIHGRPLMDEDGRIMGAVVVLNDVTRLRRLEKARRDFVANVSHELRTPVTSIIGYIETLEETVCEDPDAARQFLQIVLRQSERLERIIEDLLSLARIERDAEGLGIELVEANLDDVMNSALTSIDQVAKSHQMTIVKEGQKGVHAVVNPPLIEQALINLLTNAIKYSDNGTTVLVRVIEKKKRILLQVADEGVGIAQEHLPRVFERFYRVDKGRSRAEGGTGLGLAIVKHIALAHGGTVSLESEIGVGTTFTLEIPKSEHLINQLDLLESL